MVPRLVPRDELPAAATLCGVAVGLAGSLPLALLLLTAAGAADMSSAIFRSTLWNQTIPDRLRGRLARLYSTGSTPLSA
jgi:hypothetical protein